MLNLRTLILIVGTGLFFILFYYYNESQQLLAKWGRERDKCQQNLDAISAQLQVVYEHKSRLEKSLKVEKDNVLKEKTDKEKQVRVAKTSSEQHKAELAKTQEKMQQQQSDLEKQLDDLQVKYSNLQRNFNELSDDKQNAETKTRQELEEAKRRQKEVEFQLKSLREELESLRAENSQLKRQLLSTSSNFMVSTQKPSINFAHLESDKGLVPTNGPNFVVENLINNNNSDFSSPKINSSSSIQNQPSNDTNGSKQIEKQIPQHKENAMMHEEQVPMPAAQIDDRYKYTVMPKEKINNKNNNVAPVLKHPMDEDQQNWLEKNKEKNSDLLDKENANGVLPVPKDLADFDNDKGLRDDIKIDQKEKLMREPDDFKMHDDGGIDRDEKFDQEKYDLGEKKDKDDDDLL